MEKSQIIVDVQASPLSEAPIVVDLEASLQSELDTLWGNENEAENFTIFRTPHGISKSKMDLFEPSVISIGPFHRGGKHLRAMEEQKKRFLRDFLSRADHITLDLCIAEMKLLETRTRRCYSETFDDLDSHAFVKMMVLDGCFLLEFFLKKLEESWNSILEVGWNSYLLQFDLLLQENQIPFFIVDKLYELTIGFNQVARKIFVKYIAYSLLPIDTIFPDPPAETPDTIDSIIVDPPVEIPYPVDSNPDPPAEIPDPVDSNRYPPVEIPDPVDSIPDSTHPTDSTEFLDEIPDPPAEIHHLVHLCYHYLVPNPEKPIVLSSKSFDLTRMFSANRIIKGLLHRFRSMVLRGGSSHLVVSNSTANLSLMVIPSATELKESGLKFTRKNKPRHLLDISFEYGVLQIPKLVITDATKTIFANLIAFEHSKYGKEHFPFTSFVYFLDNLVNTQNDVTILQQCGIIENFLGSEEELAHFINQVTEGNVTEEGHYLADLYKEVNRYIESSWHRHRAKLIRDYFSSPWAAISLVAALILLVLTCVQTFYAVYAYKFPPSS